MVRMDFSNRPAKKAPDTLLADTGLEGALASLLAGVQPASRRIYTSHARAFARWLAQEGLTARDTDEAALGRYRETLYQEKARETARVAYSVASALIVILKEEEQKKEREER